jgi:hypothetical protein
MKKSLRLFGLRKIKVNYVWLVISLYFLCLFWSSSLLSKINPTLDVYTLRLVWNTASVQTMLSSIGAILATILAISFSIAIIVIQHAASNYTASIIESYKRDDLTLLFFSYYVGALIFSIMGLQFSNDLYIVNMILVTFIFSFFILGLHFIHIINLIDPRNIIERAEKHCIKYITSIPSKVQSIIKKIKPSTTYERSIVSTPLYRQFVFYNDSTLQEPIKKQVLLINDVINKAASRREIETSIKGFQAITRITRNYITIRKDDFTTQDKFLEYINAQLLTAFSLGLDNKDTALMQEVLYAFTEIGCLTTELKSSECYPPQSTNLVFTHIRDLGMKALEQDFVDVSTIAMESMKKVGYSAIQKNGGEGLSSDYIFEMGKAGIQKNSWYMLSIALIQLKDLLYGFVLFKGNVYASGRILKFIDKLASLSMENRMNHWAIQTSLFTLLPEYSIQKVAFAALKAKNEEYPEKETFQREEFSKEIMNQLVRAIGNIANTSSKLHSAHILGSSIDCLLDLSLLMLNEKFKSLTEGFKEELLIVIKIMKSAYIHIAGYSFDEEWFLSAPSEIGDAVTTIAVLALEFAKDITDGGLEALNEMCLSMIKRDKSGYGVSRLAARIGVIGAVALSKNETQIAEKAATLLANFEASYQANSLEPRKGETIRQLKGLHKNRSYRTGKYLDVYQNLEDSNIESFIKLVPQK